MEQRSRVTRERGFGMIMEAFETGTYAGVAALMGAGTHTPIGPSALLSRRCD